MEIDGHKELLHGVLNGQRRDEKKCFVDQNLP